MKYKKVILAGGNGYLGGVLATYYKNLADEVIILARKFREADDNVQTLVWDGKTEGDWVNSLNGADLLINLCGKNVNCRYTKVNQADIINSRIIPTLLLGKVVKELAEPPKLWINITSATIYRRAQDRPQDEDNGEIGYGFSIDVCRKWEEAFFLNDTPNTRRVALRMGIVLGRNGAVFPRLLNLVKCGIGGRQGDGQQYVSWVHEQDAAKSTEWILQNEELNGVINCVAPEPAKSEDLMKSIRKGYGAPFGLPSPMWLIELGAFIIQTEPELIFKSRWVLPKRLLDSGYSFLFAKADHAVKDILSIRV